jgi:DNA (cytosine-5)-methyltransferase 1
MSKKGSYAMVKDEKPPCFVDVFAGCGGLSLGLKRAGWTGVFAIEKDAFAFETLNSNFPSGDDKGSLSYKWPATIERKAWDIRRLIKTRRAALEELSGEVDLLAGGPPCQGFSHAGRRRRDDPRNRLFEAYLELVDILQPNLVLVENVRGFTSDFKTARKGSIKNFAETLEEMLSESYDTVTSIIRASDFGVPQVRPRFFLIGRRKGSARPEQIEEFFVALQKYSPTFLSEHGLPRAPSARDAISDLEVVRNGVVDSCDTKGFEAIAYKAPRTAYQKAMRGDHKGVISDTRLARHGADIKKRFADIIKTCKEEGRLNTNLSAETRRAYKLKKAALRVLDPLSPAPTITSLPDDLLHYSEPRTLTVRENARLQSFPDWFEFHGKYTSGGLRRRKEVPRFTQVANAVPPLLAEQIGFALLTLLRRGKTVDIPAKGFANSAQCVALRSEPSAEILHPCIVNRNRELALADRPKARGSVG